jgi:hypothetical protein
VLVFHHKLLFRGRVRDISRAGCFIETGARLNIDRFAEVELQFTAQGVHVRSLARVMDVRPGKGAGFEFLPGDPRLANSLATLIDFLNRDSEAHASRGLIK